MSDEMEVRKSPLQDPAKILYSYYTQNFMTYEEEVRNMQYGIQFCLVQL